MLQSIRVADYMAHKLVTLRPDMSIDQAIRSLLDNGISGAPVVQDGKLVGVFSESDCLKDVLQSVYHNMGGGLVSDFMTAAMETISPDESIITAAEIFLNHRRRRLPVVDANGRLVGQISRRDVLRAIADLSSKAPA
ncbi:MAG: CBS domain-containing protein [Moraxellaceae bacterium]|nr:CBS domain-containing protein [Moraxellaceae bacterium]